MHKEVPLSALLLPLVLVGCSPKKPVANEKSSNAPALRRFTIVESQDTRERKQIRAQAMVLFTNRAFSELDALAAKYRASQEGYPMGIWKLASLYSGLEPDRDAPLGAWKSCVTGAEGWIREHPKSITARVAKARLLAEYGWAIRSGSWADTVKEKEWPRSADRLGGAAGDMP